MSSADGKRHYRRTSVWVQCLDAVDEESFTGHGGLQEESYFSSSLKFAIPMVKRLDVAEDIGAGGEPFLHDRLGNTPSFLPVRRGDVQDSVGRHGCPIEPLPGRLVQQFASLCHEQGGHVSGVIDASFSGFVQQLSEWDQDGANDLTGLRVCLT